LEHTPEEVALLCLSSFPLDTTSATCTKKNIQEYNILQKESNGRSQILMYLLQHLLETEHPNYTKLNHSTMTDQLDIKIISTSPLGIMDKTNRHSL